MSVIGLRNKTFRFLKMTKLIPATIFMKIIENIPKNEQNVHGTKYPNTNTMCIKIRSAEQSSIQHLSDNTKIRI